MLLSGFFHLQAMAAMESTEKEGLAQNITALIIAHRQLPSEANVVQHVKILSAPAQLATLCSDPELSIAGNNDRLTGNKSIIARCGNRKKFIQVNVSAEGGWWSAVRTIKPGSVVQEKDIIARTGSLDRLPADLLFSKESIVGNTATRTISSGQAVTQSQLRRPWAAVTGQLVEILAQGNGFQIRTRGKALNNAAANKPLRVATHGGQIVSGILSADGVVTINLKE